MHLTYLFCLHILSVHIELTTYTVEVIPGYYNNEPEETKAFYRAMYGQYSEAVDSNEITFTMDVDPIQQGVVRLHFMDPKAEQSTVKITINGVVRVS